MKKENNKSLKEKAIDIKGKSYVLVSDRIIYFNDNYPNGKITTEMITTPDAERIIMLAKITPDVEKPLRYFTGYSQAKWGDGFINKTSAIENAETSAVGRALAMMGIGVIDSIASVDEIKKAESTSSPIENDKLAIAKNLINSCKDLEKLNEILTKISKSNFTPKQKEELNLLVEEKINEQAPTITV